MSFVQRPIVGARRLIARRPWIHWLVVVLIAGAAAAAVAREVTDLRRAQHAWSTSETVLVASEGAAPGDAIIAREVAVPRALVPAGAVDRTSGHVARRHIGAGQVLTELDVVGGDAPLGLVPAGWRAVPIVESPASGASVGDTVDVASDGVVIADRAIVVGLHDDVTLVAVPTDRAPLVPLAAASGSVTLLRLP